ncbi:MAG: BREX system Lon protease-like protein BrxL [Bacteroidales bacterium]|nr:BREX system Lon protease-like protein BrxL [Bacteroidales bacterium]
MDISNKIKQIFPDLAMYKSGNRDNLFGGRNLPSFVKDYIVKRFSDSAGVIDREAVKDYLDTKMNNDGGQIRQRLLRGDKVNLTCRIVVQSDLKAGKTAFNIADVDLQSDAYILPSVIDSHLDDLIDGENWGNITLEYFKPQGSKKEGYVNMTSFRPFRPYSVDYDYFLKARTQFSLEEWMDVLISAMEYNPDSLLLKNEEESIMRKHEFLSRLLIAVEPRLNMIELGPKGTGKSWIYSNLSKWIWLVGNGGITRARMFYNRSSRQFGVMKTHDAVIIDEAATLVIKDDELRSLLKVFLESGRVGIDNVNFQSDCGFGLEGNIGLTAELQPIDKDYWRSLPTFFRDSATLDRFHVFIEGWKLPRLGIGSIVDGWSLNTEYISEIFHTMRFKPEYAGIFEDIVSYDLSSDLRDLKAVKKIATAYAKLLFPHITDFHKLTADEQMEYKNLYEKYCLAPAIKKRSIIREQCHLLDKEYQTEMPVFNIIP